MDFARSKKTKNTKAIIIQHTFGIPVDITEVLELANEYGLIVIEDCVHALGAKYKDKKHRHFWSRCFF